MTGESSTMHNNRGLGDDGFTLIELLVVIVILGTLSAVVVFAVGNLTDRGTQAACQADVKSVEVAMEVYNAKMGDYPNNMNQLTGNDGFLKSLPSNPKYNISINPGTGAVTVAPACSSLQN